MGSKGSMLFSTDFRLIELVHVYIGSLKPSSKMNCTLGAVKGDFLGPSSGADICRVNKFKSL